MATLATLLVKIQGDNANFIRALERSQSRSQKFRRSLQRDFTRIGMGLAAAGTAAVAFAALSIRSFAQTGDEIQKMALRTGFTTEALSEFKFVAEQTGTSLEGMEKAVRRMQQSIFDAERGLSTATDAYEAMGLSVEQLRGKSPEQQFSIMTSALADVEDASTKAALAAMLFGRAGTQLLPMLASGSEGIEKLREEAQRLGIVFDQDAADAAARMNDSMNSMRKSFQGLQFAIAENVVPAITDLIDKITPVIVGFVDWAKANPGLVKGILTVSAATLGLGAAMISLVWALRLVKAGMGPVGWAILAIEVAIAAGILVWQNWDKVVNIARKTFAQFSEKVLAGVEMILKGMRNLANLVGQGGVFDAAIERIAELRRELRDTAAMVGKDFVPAMERLNPNVHTTVIEMADLGAELGDTTDAMDDYTNATQSAARETEALLIKLNGQVKMVGEGEEAWLTLDSVLRRTDRTYKSTKVVLESMIESYDGLTTSVKATTAAIQAMHAMTPSTRAGFPTMLPGISRANVQRFATAAGISLEDAMRSLGGFPGVDDPGQNAVPTRSGGAISEGGGQESHITIILDGTDITSGVSKIVSTQEQVRTN